MVSDVVKKYRVSYHAGQRFLERVLKEVDPNHDEILKGIKMIQKTLAFELSNNVNGTVPFIDNYVAVIYNDVVVTIKEKDKEENHMKNLTEFAMVENKQMKEV